MEQGAYKAKLRVGVLMGGRSIEREVSFNSGRTICDHLDASIYEVVPLYQTADGILFVLPWHFLHRGKTSDFEHRLRSEARMIVWDDLRDCADFIYIALHGKFAEDGTVQGMLTVLGIPYLGSDILASAICMNKNIHKQILRQHGIAVPAGISVSPSEIYALKKDLRLADVLVEQLFEQKILLPWIVKPASEGSSLGISVVFNAQELADALIYAAECDRRHTQSVVVEEKIQGMEFVAITIKNLDGGWVTFPVTEVVHEQGTHFFDYEQKYMPGRASKITPARCSIHHQKMIQEVALRAHHAIGFSTISRIDGFLTPQGTVVILDSQPITGMGPSTFLFDQAAEVNMSHTELINHLIATDLQRYGFSDRMPLTGNNYMNNEQSTKIRVGVLLGGDSRELETSLDSGRNVCYKLFPNKYEVIPLFVTSSMELYKISQRELVKNSTRDIVPLLSVNQKIPWARLGEHCDFIFNALHGGKGENGAVQGALDMIQMPYNGSGVFASALCMDKYKTNEFLRHKGFDVSPSLLVTKQEWFENKVGAMDRIKQTVTLPCIIKPHDDGCSMLVYKIKTFEQCENVLDEFFKTEKTVALVEEFIKGVELTCGVVGNEKATALPPSQPVIQNEILSIQEKFLPGAGENQTPAPLPHDVLEFVKRTMEAVYEAIGCSGYVRIDCFYQSLQISPSGKQRVVILEINTLPGLTPATCIFHQAAEIGLKPMDFIDLIISLGFKRFESLQGNAHLASQPKELHINLLVE